MSSSANGERMRGGPAGALEVAAAVGIGHHSIPSDVAAL